MVYPGVAQVWFEVFAEVALIEQAAHVAGEEKLEFVFLALWLRWIQYPVGQTWLLSFVN